MTEVERIDRALRWRLVLGAFAEEHLALPGEGDDGDSTQLAEAMTQARAMEQTLQFIYDREHQERSHRADRGFGNGLSIPVWLNQVRELFPAEARQVLERDALQRYGLTELITDPAILARAEPTFHLLEAIVQFKHLMKGDVLTVARQQVKAVVEQLRSELETHTHAALHGPSRPDGGPAPRTFRNVDWTRTIRRNLRHMHPEHGLVPDRISYRRRSQHRSRWRIIVCVDQSGSMTDSLVHSAVMAAIFAALPAVTVNLVLWDHRIVDASEHVHDPLEILMNVQLGGGTDMLPALQYATALITEPERTLFLMISDFQVWGDKDVLLAACGDLVSAGVKAMGLCAVGTGGRPVYDERFTNALADRGWWVGAVTPRHLAEYVGRVLRG